MMYYSKAFKHAMINKGKMHNSFCFYLTCAIGRWLKKSNFLIMAINSILCCTIHPLD